MLEHAILQLIERRRNGFRHRYSISNDQREAERSRSIAEEYDSLIVEINELDHQRALARIAPIFEEDQSEEWILGDQGQLGG